MKRTNCRWVVCAGLLLTCGVAQAAWNGINYQGRLLEGGAPFSGATNFHFSVYTQLVGGAYAYDETDVGVTVVDGLYTTVIGDNPSGLGPLTLKQTLALTTPLYLQIAVGATVLTPREQLNAVPYAMDADTLDGVDSYGFLSTSGGLAMNTTAGPVLTVSQGGSTTNSHGILAGTSSSGHGAAGVYGVAAGFASGLPLEAEVGVRGESATGVGVAGLALQDVGVYGVSSNAQGMLGISFNSYGLHAASLRTNAIYAEGSIKADKLVYRYPRTNYYVVGCTEFQTRGLEEFDNAAGMYLLDGLGTIYAPIHLPHGATIIQFDARVYDSVTTTGQVVTLSREAAFGGSASDMAQVVSSGSAGWQLLTDTSISDAVVDNSNYFYYAWNYNRSWSSSNKWYAARIVYTVDEAP